MIRADASDTLGSGHVMRCLTLADAIAAHAAVLAVRVSISFICRSSRGHLQQLIRQRGYQIIAIEECVDQRQDAAACLAAIDQDYDCLIVDHYQLGAEFEAALRSRCHTVMVIDDLANRPHLADILLDQNLLPDASQRYHSLVSAECVLLLGPKYTLLRAEFDSVNRRASADCERLLVFLGGSDPDNHTDKVLAAIARLATPMPVDVVLGQHNPWNQQLLERYGHHPWLTVHIQCDYMAKLMSAARLSIGAGGSSHWERCACALPAIVMTIAANQEATTAYLAELGACINMGDAAAVSAAALVDALAALWDDLPRLEAISAQASELIPAKGSALVASQLVEFITQGRVFAPDIEVGERYV
nr:UDP-2,4-diacetamido-2,4,6-trideoxy-beta-L-altropyranose hydrolase [Shewanella sp. NIFS-20-20]